MEYLSEDHANLLHAKEWLVKVDNDTSTPYLLKFYASTVDLKCFVAITDTRSVWAETLSSHQVARRWRDCNPSATEGQGMQEEEDSWREKCIEFLAALHSLGGIAELTFELVKSNYSDLAFELRNDTFRWRWETFAVGPKLSADLLSKQLIMPLISVTHLSFSSADSVGKLSAADLEKSADRIGRIARRTVGTHVKNTLSKPVVATTLRRMDAVFNFVPDPPRIVADAQAPDLRPPSPPAPPRAVLEPPLRRAVSPPALKGFLTGDDEKAKAAVPQAAPKRTQDDDSVTEEEPDEDDFPPLLGKGKDVARDQRSTRAKSSSPALSVPSKRATPDEPEPPPSRKSPSSPTRSSSPLPPPKKTKKAVSSSDDDSEDERKKYTAQAKSTARRGVKQPIKRGGRRF
ncbi:hypothetical protein GY45DRAFT_1323923 [Cubamyces sp. BRFM 1775]|nr:hypothetical protein GY45DRAFT_1323923 [Cubamyces sp. BRFM 1775]